MNHVMRSGSLKAAQEYLRQFEQYLDRPLTPQQIQGLEENSRETHHFRCTIYPLLLQELFQRPDFKQMEFFASRGDAATVIPTILQWIKREGGVASSRRDALLTFLHRFWYSDVVTETMVRRSLPAFQHSVQEGGENWIQQLLALPEIIANAWGMAIPGWVRPVAFGRNLARHLIQSFVLLGFCAQNSTTISMKVLAEAASVAIQRSPNVPDVLDPLLKGLSIWTRQDFLARRLVARFVQYLPDRVLGRFVSYCAQWAKSAEQFTLLVGGAYLENEQKSRVKQRITSQFLFSPLSTQFDDNARMLRNLLGYLSRSFPGDSYWQAALQVLQVWADPTALQVSPPVQHLYWSQALLLFVSEKPTERTELELVAGKLLRIVLEGVRRRLQVAEAGTRAQGMLVAQVWTKLLRPEAPTPEFPIPATDLVRDLKKLTEPLTKDVSQDDQDVEDFVEHLKAEEAQDVLAPDKKKSSEVVAAAEDKASKPKIDEATVELDSDDEFEAYDVSEESLATVKKPLVYLRDIFDFVGKENDADAVALEEQALAQGETVIKAQLPLDDPQLVERLLSVFLHWCNRFNLPNFEEKRCEMLVAVVEAQPVTSSQYLCSAVYERNFTLAHRLEMCDILATAAQRLAQIPSCDAPDGKTLGIIGSAAKKPSWKLEVERRLALKTRRFFPSQRSSRKAKIASNRFAPLAGYFFFPLASKVGLAVEYLQWEEDDHILLTQVLLTLATILEVSGPGNHVRKMAPVLAELVWYWRYHPEATVRRAVLWTWLQLVRSLKESELLHAEFLDVEQVGEWRNWLVSVIEKDTDPQMHHMATMGVAFLKASLLETVN